MDMGNLSNYRRVVEIVSAIKRCPNVLALSILLVWHATMAYAAGPMRPFQQGLWSGGAFTNDQTGAFSHCAAAVPYRSGITMHASVNRLFGWSLGFSDPQWALTPQTLVPIEIHFDGGPAFNVVGTVLLPALVVVPMPDNSRLINTFRYSSQMVAQAQGQTFYFNLNGTSRIMVLLANCVRTELALETHQPAGPSRLSVPSNPSEETQLEEARLATNFLLAAQLSGAHLLARTEIPVQLASYGAVWKAEAAVGTVKIYLPQTAIDGSRLGLPGNRGRRTKL
jgi:hypothetical protein